MTTSSRELRKVRVVLFGMRCTFTAPVLAALASAPDVDLAAVVLPGHVPASPPAQHGPVMDAIHTFGIPLIEVPERNSLFGAGFCALLEETTPDAIVAACFPWRLPARILAVPPRGCLNLHSSLLPEGRGPEPVFWAFRRGLEETGVTLHLMDEGLDTGPIIAQVRVPIPDGATILSLERSLADVGVGLVIEHLRVSAGQAVAMSPQPEEGAWYASMPESDDLVVTTSWPTDRAARFITAVTPVYGAVPVLVQATAQRFLVEKVMAIDDGESDSGPVSVHDDMVRIRFAAGALTCRIRHDTQPLRLHT